MPLPAGKTEVNQGNLTIRNLSPADSGLYECVASNVMGTKKAKMNLVVQQVTLGLYLQGEKPVREGGGGRAEGLLARNFGNLCKENQPNYATLPETYFKRDYLQVYFISQEF